MSDSDSDNPAEIYLAANAATLNLSPEKSRQIYLKQYEIFMKWCNIHHIKKLKEEVFLAFFLEKTNVLKSSTLWSVYSMLKSTNIVKNNIDISKFSKLNAFLKKQNVGYKAKKSAVFTRENINKFLTEAPDKNYLMWKIAASELVKDHQAAVTAASELPLKKQKLDEYLGTLGRVPSFPLPAAAAAIMQQQLYSALEPVYIHRCLQEYNNVRGHLSAFKPVAQSIREQKLRSANALGIATRCAADPPLLQNPERVVMMSESERFERTYQPNVALAPPTPKKHRYGRAHETATSPQQCSSSTMVEKCELLSPLKAEPPPHSPLMNGHHIKEEAESAKSPPSSTSPEKLIDSTVSVLQSNNSILIQPPKYNPEIELSTDTEDSASETSEKNNSDYAKLEEVLKSVNNDDVREKVLDLFKNLSKERERAVLETRTKDQDRMSELEGKNAELERENAALKRELEDFKRQTENNNKPVRELIIKDTNSDLVTSSSIIVQPTTEDKAVSPAIPCVLQKSVIASVASVASSVANGIPNNVANNVEAQSDVIKNTAPE